ncbi:putative cinnamoyl-CoA reductase [Hypoxylon trugodes]|uniref:putative cinnamoyl-CoA reductase n=1 Tax=Hypoxylon trugodes TaxID=326681 RepID=UPI0021983E4D|nr:putative cinnamoyl-CoA reductase [Hypoxylon trugodes]KAI1389362.1 putative cinnamoyl-CoA reductase [Hypoxylon trugodes]
MAATILITGTTGLIGFRILLAALAAGHRVRYTVRSEEKAQKVSSNPAVQKLAPGDRLSPVIIPDFTADGAFDSALQGVTHVIHAGSPVPVPTYDPVTEVFEPTVKISSGLLASALKAPSLQRVIITSSIVANLGLIPPPTTVSASTRVPLPSPIPTAFSSVFEAYVQSKIVEMHNSDEFVKTQNPHFTVSHVVPGYTFGWNELMLDPVMMQTQNSSNNFLMMGITGGQLPMPIHGGYGHIDDVADLHLRVAFLDPSAGGPRDFGLATKLDYTTLFDYVEKAFPKAVAEGIFKRGVIPTLPVEYDSSDAVKLLGRPIKSFENAVVDVASQYLELLGKEKA